MTRQEMIANFDEPSVPELAVDFCDIMEACRKIGFAAKFNEREVNTLADTAVENASDVAECARMAVACSAMESFVNGDTRGRDLDYLLEYCRPRSRAAAKLIKQE